MSALRWMRFWFDNSYDLWRSHPTWRSQRWYATWRGLNAAVGGIRAGYHRRHPWPRHAECRATSWQQDGWAICRGPAGHDGGHVWEVQ